MKKYLFLLLVSLHAYGAARYYTFTWADTNASDVVTNIARSLATNVVTQNAPTYPGYVFTNRESVSANFSNIVTIDAASTLYLSNLTASRMVFLNANQGASSAAASGAVPMDADGSATTFAQVNALAPGNVLTNNESLATVFSNNVTIDAAHTMVISNQSGPLKIGGPLDIFNSASGNVNTTLRPSLLFSTADTVIKWNSQNAGAVNIFGGGSTLVGIATNSANGGLEINQGTAGTKTNLTVRNIIADQLGIATNGFQSWRSNQVALYSVTLGASPYSWANTNNCNVFALLAGGTVSAITLNGTTLPAAFLTGSDTLPMQTNETVVITYTVAPTLLIKPF